jgi:hypothetical protein
LFRTHEVDHRCRVKLCVRLEHLEHPKPESIKIDALGREFCFPCAQAADRRRKERRRAGA